LNLERAWKLHDEFAAKLARGPGSVFTPRHTAVRLAQLTLGPLIDPPTLLDPACGAGALLLGAIEWAFGERPLWIDHWAGGALAGWDTVPGCVSAANAVLAQALGLSNVKPAKVRDGLAASAEFDAVIANPPWISFSGRHAGDLDPGMRVRLAAKFPAFAGWPALHTAFAEQCSRLTRQDTGRLGLLLPMQMADLAGYGAARRAITSRLTLEHAIDLGEQVFDGVTEPAGLFVFGAGAGTDRPWLADEDNALLARVRRFAPLPHASFGDVGVHTGNAAQLLVARQGAGRPLRVGRDIQPFSLATPSHVLRDIELPEGRYARVASEARYRDAVIVLRQTASRPIAARHDPWALFRNSVLACYGDPVHDVDYLLGVFNSDTMARIHRAMFRDARQRTFPQVKISHLRALPIPGREIGNLYRRVVDHVRGGQPVHELVARAYGL
jgi:hypothetical protein